MENNRLRAIPGNSSESEVSAAGIVSLTEAVEEVLQAFTVVVTGAEIAESTEAVTEAARMTGTVALTRVAWWRTARRRSLWAGAGGGEGEHGEVVEEEDVEEGLWLGGNEELQDVLGSTWNWQLLLRHWWYVDYKE